MSEDVVLVGGGEHARVVAEAIRSRPDRFRLLGFVDPAPCEETVARLGLPRLGDDGWLAARPDVRLALGVGAVGPGPARRRLVEAVGGAPERWVAVAHAAAHVSPTARLAAGSVVMAGATVQSGARLGFQAVVNTAAVVEHDVALGDYAQVGPGAVLGGGCAVGPGAYVGLGARLRDHVTIGEEALVGMGAAVVADVPARTTVVGVPARPRRTEEERG